MREWELLQGIQAAEQEGKPQAKEKLKKKFKEAFGYVPPIDTIEPPVNYRAQNQTEEPPYQSGPGRPDGPLKSPPAEQSADQSATGPAGAASSADGVSPLLRRPPEQVAQGPNDSLAQWAKNVVSR